MTNEIKTRRLIITVPDVSGEEIDTIAADLEFYMANEAKGYGMQEFAVRHALGESLPEGAMVRVANRGTMFASMVEVRTPYDNGSSFFTQSEARSLAGALLAAADQLAEGTPAP